MQPPDALLTQDTDHLSTRVELALEKWPEAGDEKVERSHAVQTSLAGAAPLRQLIQRMRTISP
jgi:hypothetical protein